jgi:hypothetical protein
MAQKNDIVIDQGTTFSTIVNLVDAANNPINLTGFTAVAQMKKWYTSLTYTPFTTSINATAGSITLSLTANVTSNIIHGEYVYDVDVIDISNNVTRVVEGIATVTPGVTNMTVEDTANTYSNNNFTTIPLDG